MRAHRTESLCETTTCHMRVLQAYFSDSADLPGAAACGHCDNCRRTADSVAEQLQPA